MSELPAGPSGKLWTMLRIIKDPKSLFDDCVRRYGDPFLIHAMNGPVDRSADETHRKSQGLITREPLAVTPRVLFQPLNRCAMKTPILIADSDSGRRVGDNRAVTLNL